jgi:hypothetical protein
MTGCMQRSLVITSEPAGATVYVNDAEVGRTPLEVGFTYYGTYDVLVTKDGYEPLRTKAEAIAPVYEHPPLDLAAHAMPWGVRTRVPWHFTLEALATSPEAKKAQETALLERAAATRARLQPGGGVRATASPD